MKALTNDYGNALCFMQKMNADMQMSKLTENVKECVLGHYPLLNQIKNGYGENVAVSWLIVHLATFQERATVKTKLTEVQLETLARLVLSGFANLRVSEFLLFLRQSLYDIRYEQYYGIIDMRIFMQNLQKFMKEVVWQTKDEYEAEQAMRKAEEDLANSMTADEWIAYKKEHNIPTDPKLEEMERMIRLHGKANEWREKHGFKQKTKYY